MAGVVLVSAPTAEHPLLLEAQAFNLNQTESKTSNIQQVMRRKTRGSGEGTAEV